jgi:hypothetical protein
MARLADRAAPEVVRIRLDPPAARGALRTEAQRRVVPSLAASRDRSQGIAALPDRRPLMFTEC